jgi:hypothetical protein
VRVSVTGRSGGARAPPEQGVRRPVRGHRDWALADRPGWKGIASEAVAEVQQGHTGVNARIQLGQLRRRVSWGGSLRSPLGAYQEALPDGSACIAIHRALPLADSSPACWVMQTRNDAPAPRPPMGEIRFPDPNQVLHQKLITFAGSNMVFPKNQSRFGSYSDLRVGTRCSQNVQWDF